mgnify:CR=1 FL=1
MWRKEYRIVYYSWEFDTLQSFYRDLLRLPVDARGVALARHGVANLRRVDRIFVVFDLHAAEHEADLCGFDAVELARGLFHVRLTCGAGHAFYVKCLFHDSLPP